MDATVKSLWKKEKFYRTKYNELRAVAVALLTHLEYPNAEHVPPLYYEDETYPVCAHCMLPISSEDESGDLDHELHAENCPWALLRDVVKEGEAR